MKVHVPLHAEMRFLERGIDIDNVKKVVRSNKPKIPTFDDRIKVTDTLSDDRTLTVIYKEEKNKFIIITAYYENKS